MRCFCLARALMQHSLKGISMQLANEHYEKSNYERRDSKPVMLQRALEKLSRELERHPPGSMEFAMTCCKLDSLRDVIAVSNLQFSLLATSIAVFAASSVCCSRNAI